MNVTASGAVNVKWTWRGSSVGTGGGGSARVDRQQQPQPARGSLHAATAAVGDRGG